MPTPTDPAALAKELRAADAEWDCFCSMTCQCEPTRVLIRRAATALESLSAENAATLAALRTESARLDHLLGSYRIRNALLESGALDLDIVSEHGARAAIDAARNAIQEKR